MRPDQADVRDVLEGTLVVKRLQRYRRSQYVLSAMLADIVQPRYWKDPLAYVTAEGDTVVGLKGKILQQVQPEDSGRPVRVEGMFRWNPKVLRKLGSVRRVKLTFLDEVS